MTAKEKAQRSCLGCQQVLDQDLLLRFVVTPELKIHPDLRRKLPGRGAYACFKRACLIDAVRRKRFQRSFKMNELQVDIEALLAAVTAQLLDRILGLVCMGRKSGQIISGSNMVLDALREPQRLGLVLLAEDASSGIADKVAGKATDKGVPWFKVVNKESLGDLLGKEERSTIGFKTGSLADSLLVELIRYRSVVGDG